MASRVGIGGRQFRPGLFATALTLVVVVFLTSLGRWQLQRMAEKQALFVEFAEGGRATVALAAKAARYQHVAESGRYNSGHQFLLDNMTHEGRTGYRVLTPFVTADSGVVLVDRGWIPAGPTRDVLPDIRVGEDVRTISGRLDRPPARGIDLPATAASGWPRRLTYPKMRDFESALGRSVFPMIVLLDADRPDGYVRKWTPSTFPPERHLGYAITWFALAATVAILYIVTNFKKRLRNS